jgi:hypothetical protein
MLNGVKSQGSRCVELRVFLESMFCLIDLLRLVTMLKRKVYKILERYMHMGD